MKLSKKILIAGSIVALSWGCFSVYLGAQNNNQGEFYDTQTGAWDISYTLIYLLSPVGFWFIIFLLGTAFANYQSARKIGTSPEIFSMTHQKIELGILLTFLLGLVCTITLDLSLAFYNHPTLFIIIVIIEHILALSFFILLLLLMYVLLIKQEYKQIKYNLKNMLLLIGTILLVIFTCNDYWLDLTSPLPILHDQF